MSVQRYCPTHILDWTRSVAHGTRLSYNLVNVRPLLWAFAQHPPYSISVHAFANEI